MWLKCINEQMVIFLMYIIYVYIVYRYNELSCKRLFSCRCDKAP